MPTVAKKKEIRWTPRLIRQLRGKRSLAEFANLIDAAKNTVWRWEAGTTAPDADFSDRLSRLAEREHFLRDWKIQGSMKLLQDIEGADAEIARLFGKSLQRTTHELTE